MNTYLLQLLLAARNDDGEGWMQLLIMLIMAVLWAIGGILKARANKVPPEEEEQPEQIPASGRRQASRKVRMLRMQNVQPGPVARKIIKVKPAMSPEPSLTSLKTMEEEVIPEKFIGKSYKELEAEQLGILPKTTQPKAGMGKLPFGFEDPDELRKAILHYEILGKPLSLREP